MAERKREPLLADKFLAEAYGHNMTSGLVPRNYWETTRSNLLLAKRFVLSEQAIQYCGQMLNQAPRIVADAQDFAIPPFDRTYIEIPARVLYETVTGLPSELPTSDTRLGYLVVKSDVRVLVENTDDVALGPIEYHLNQPLPLKQEVELASKLGTSRSQFDYFYWGASVTSLGTVTKKHGLQFDEWQKEGLRSLRANHSFSINLRKEMHEKLPNVWDQFYTGSAGDLRNIIALLIFLNRTPKWRYEREEPFQHRIVNRKPVNLLKHRVITLHVDPLPKLLRLAAGEGIRRRLHDVRGHFCHNEIARTNHHEHEWTEDLERDLHWICPCGGLRWWRKEHKRGNEEKGIVTSIYDVKK